MLQSLGLITMNDYYYPDLKQVQISNFPPYVLDDEKVKT